MTATIKELEDYFCTYRSVDTRKVTFNLACGVFGGEQISPAEITVAFEKKGMFPFMANSQRRFKDGRDTVKEKGVLRWEEMR